MRTLLKFNLFFLPLLLLALAGSGFVIRESLQRNAEQEVLQNARVMMETMTATRSYTTKQIAPLLQNERFKIDRSTAAQKQLAEQLVPAALQQVVDQTAKPGEKETARGVQRLVLESIRQRPQELPETEFHPQTIPAFAATEIFNYFRARYPDYNYKEATLNPTNPRDRTVDWEADIVNGFRQNDKMTEFVGQRQTPSGASLFLGVPLRINNSSCLVCHSTPDKAPPEMIKTYGSANGFGWKLNEIIGAQIVSVPAAIPIAIADEAFRRIAFALVAIFGVLFLLANVAVALLVRRPAGA